MSGYILCQTKKAERPYFIENISTNIYSIEELCYYLYHNLYLIDASVINEELCMWIQQELELPKLAAKLRPKLQNYTNAEDVLYPIFKEINYLTYEELKNLNSRMALLNQESPALRQKRKGDCLVENRMYVNAIQVYQKLLEQNPDSERTDFAADVLYNLGCAYSYLFQMEKALECFWVSYEKSQSQTTLKTYLLAYRNTRNKKDYEHRVSELKITEELKKELKEAWKEFEKIPEKPVEGRESGAMLEDLMKDYHRTTGS